MAAKKKDNSKPVQKLTGKELLQKYWHLLVIFVILTILGMWAGYAVEIAGGIKKVVKSPENFIAQYFTLSTLGSAFVQMLSMNGGAFDGFKFGAIAGLMAFFGFAKTGKRFHRKGVEHGSARWGSQAEKDIIADTNDFYNNVICASDVLLVLNRKKRDENAMTPKELAEYKQKKTIATNKENERVQILEDELSKIKELYGG